MKRSFKNLFMIIAILATSFASNLKVSPVEALGRMIPIPAMPGLPTPPGASSPLSQGQLKGIWGADNSHIFSVGHGHNGTGTLVKPVIYQTANGTVWNSYSPALPVGFGWGTGYLEAVWGKDDTHVYAVGRGGVGSSANLPLVSTWDGSDWVASSPTLPSSSWNSGELFGIWGTTVGTTIHLWAVGKGGGPSFTNMPLVFHSEGGSWTSRGLTLPGGYIHATMVDVWGTSNTNIYAVGLGEDASHKSMPLLYRYNGTTWSPTTFALPVADWTWGSLEAIWGFGASDIYVVGQGGNTTKTAPLIYHWDGSQWTGSNPSLPSTYWTSGYLKGVWGDGTDVYISGHGYDGNLRLTAPLLYRKTSNGWAVSSYPPSGWASGLYEGIWGYDADHVYGVGYGLNGVDTPLLAYAVSDDIAPGPVTSLTATAGTTAGSIKLTWTAPADDGPNPPDPYAGPVDAYIVRYSTSNNLTSCDDTDGTLVTSGLPMPVIPGNTQTMTISGLTPGTEYYFAVCARDEETNTSTYALAQAIAPSNGIGIYDDNHSAWQYSGSWLTYSGTGPYANTLHYTSAAGATAEMRFSGARFALAYTKGPNRGSFEVWLDDTTYVTTVNAYSSSFLWQQTYSSPEYTNGVHKVTLKNVNTGGADHRHRCDPDPGTASAACSRGIVRGYEQLLDLQQWVGGLHRQWTHGGHAEIHHY
ncbi:MAG TPA: fibronectin type III domain-containing protein, partial [Anaerolineales bacterium]|nr:fibronectin type III domain-containing protein [Anaerolineales bacterium]